MTEKDPLTALRASMDQAGALTKEIAPVLKTFYDSNVKEGFSSDEALALTIELLRRLFKAP